MDLGSIFLILALLLLVGLFISRPLLERKSAVVSQEEHEYSGLLAERDRILDALQELDFDFTLGKIPHEDYPFQRQTLLQRGAAVLRKLDSYQTEGSGEGAEVRLEAAIAARRLQAAPNSASSRTVRQAPDDDLEVLIASRRRERSEKAAGFCPKCGRPVQKSDRFCPRCGATVV
jgi:hypothetical protein